MEKNQEILIEESLVSRYSNGSEFRVHPQRRAVFFIYFVQNLFCGFLYLSFKQIKESISYSYDAPVQYQRFASPLFMIGKLVGIFFSYWVNNKLGMKKSNMLGIIIMIVGCIVRFGIFISFNYVFIGQFIVGFGTSIILIQNIKFVFNWFSQAERKYYYAILLVAYQIGISLGIIYSTLVVETKPRIIEVTQNEINEFNVHILMMAFVILILSHFFFGQKPPKKFGWSNFQYNKTYEKNLEKTIFQRIKNILTNKQMLNFIIIYSLKVLIEACLTNSFKPIFQQINYPKSLPNYLNFSMWIIGTLGTFFYFRFLYNINDRLFFSLYSILQLAFFSVGTICILKLYSYWYFVGLFLASSFFGFLAVPLIFEKIVTKFYIEDLDFLNSFLLAFQIIFSLFGYYLIQISQLIFHNKKDANFMNQSFIALCMFLLAIFAIKIE